MDETTEVGSDAGAPVSDDYGPGDNAFNGKVTWVQIDIDSAAEDVDHLISPDERVPARHGQAIARATGRAADGIGGPSRASRHGSPSTGGSRGSEIRTTSMW